MSLLIKRATASHAKAIKSLIESLSHFYLSDENQVLPAWFSETLELSAIQERLESNGYLHLIATVEGKLAGYIAFRGSDHLYHLFVDESYQGRGIAKALWQEALNETKASKVTLRSSVFAIPVYRSFGFVESSERAEKDGIAYQPMIWLSSGS